MAEADDKEKAEKLAAAKKRFEELKKQQQKKAGKKGAAKKKEEKVEDAGAKDEDTTSTAAAESGETEEAPAEDTEATSKDDGADKTDDSSKTKPARAPSLTAQSRQRSTSFRKGGTVPDGPKSPTLAKVDAEGEVQEVYRKQAARIEELEKEVAGSKTTESKLRKAEEELEKLRDASGDVVELRSKAAVADERATEVEKLKADLAASQRQLAQAQQQAANNKARRTSTAAKPSDLSEQLASKTSTIESLELELSNLRYQASAFESDKSGFETNLKAAEERAAAAETKVSTLEAEMQTLKDNIANSTKQGSEKNDGVNASALQNRITVLESELRTAQAGADAATNKSNNFESKIETLTKLHRESSTQNAAREKEIKELKARVKALTTERSSAAGEELSDLEEEEREKLSARIRDLEAENFELRRGVWRDKRTAMQPGMNGEAPLSPSYEDVDLNGGAGAPYGAGVGASIGRPSSGARQSSTFSDVLQSGISAFTGRDNPRSGGRKSSAGAADGHARKQSLGLLDEEEFDEDAFRQAQEDDAKRRIERVREVKRGLDSWRTWRMDLVEARQNGLPGIAAGPIFEV